MTKDAPVLERMSDEQRARWNTDGYLIVEGLLSEPEVDQLMRVVDRLREEDHLDAATSPGNYNAFNVVERDDALLDVMDHPSLLGLVADLLGANVQLLMSQVMVRRPTPGIALGWHHDGPKPYPFPQVNGLTPLLNLKVGVFLTDVSAPETGNLMVIPGSHLVPEVPLEGSLTHSADETTEVDATPAGALPVLARPGDAILFHNGLWHAVAPSTVERLRTVLYYTYGPVWLRLGDRDEPSRKLSERSGPVRQQLLGALARPADHGGMHPGPEGTPLLSWVESRSYTSVMEDEFRRELA